YITPEFGGFSAAVSTQFKDTGDANKRATSFNVGYTGGPLYVALGYEQQKNDAGLDSKQTRVVGSYDFGAAKLLASVGDKKDYATDLTIGVDVPLGAALTLSAGYTVADYDAGGDKGQAVGLALAYSLSKRTVLYTGFNKLNDEAVAASGYAEHTFALGIKHSF
ncbi:MAG: porin, partial [Hydrogenophaga sp.]|uniref:porin n=1 Tax=Hydrogenophaga sp. TaxID=1904254 RepID=UPI002A3713F7